MVKLARKARSRTVEFEWSFAPNELRQLRDAVFNWGSPVTGRYKCFDARVLAAINNALGEPDSALVLHEPVNTRSLDITVSCSRPGESYCLSGHASFDLVLGYGISAVNDNPETRVRLGASASDVIARSVEQLGWNLRQMTTDAFRPVTNALYGLPVAHGTHDTDSNGSETEGGDIDEVALHFHGPFSALEGQGLRCLFTDSISASSGIYLWTVDIDDVSRIWYVGQTRRSFARRTGEHIAAYLAGQYPTPNTEFLARGEHRLFQPAPSDGKMWPNTLPSFLGDYEARAPHLLALMKILRFHVAPVEGDFHLHNRLEGALGRHFKTHDDASVMRFFDQGIQLPARIPFDSPLRALITSDAPIAGLPDRLRM